MVTTFFGFLHWEFFEHYALDTFTVIGKGHVLGVDNSENCIEAVSSG